MEDSGPELLAALESSTRASKRRRGPAALDVREPGPAANGGYTLLGTGFYSPTESINGILDKVYAATGTGKLADIGPSAAAQTDLSSSPLSSLSKSPTPPGVLTRSRPSKKAAPKPATNVVAVTTPKTTPPKSSKTDDDNPPKKKHRRIDSNDEELDDSPRTLKKEQEAFEARLQKEVNEIYKTALGNVRVHPDFPHPKAWQDIHEYGTHGYPKQRYIPPARDPPPRRNKKKKPSPQEQQQHKRKRDDNDDANEHDDSQEESFHTRPMIKIPVPDYIKSLLVDDWEEVTKNLALVPLPAPKPVNTIIDEYFEEENEKRFAGSPEMDLLEEVVSGMKEYFDVALGRMLLYRFERQQYLEVRKKWVEGKGEWKGKSCVGDTYGAEHLCRMIGKSFSVIIIIPDFFGCWTADLLVSLPEIVAQTNMDAQSVNRLREEMTKFVNWLSKNTRTYFTADYERANQEYIEKTRAN